MANNDTENSLPWMHGGRSYLLASQQGFQNIFLSRSLRSQYQTEVKLTYDELIAISKRALQNGELEIAENHLSKAIRMSKLKNVENESSWEPYFNLGEVLERKAAKAHIELQQKQRLLLQAAALYNFVKNSLKRTVIESDLSAKRRKVISGKLLDIQDYLVSIVGGNPLRCNFDPDNNRKDLAELRNEVKDCLYSYKYNSSSDVQAANDKNRKKFAEQTRKIKGLCQQISSRVKEFLARIIKECIEVLGDPPCDYEVVVLGSLARDEMTPYSDLEWAILISLEEEKCKVFFRNLTNLVHLQIINLGETILPSMGIEALSGEWFYDNVTPRGVSFDAFLPQACKTPVGNMQDFELIHTPSNMADFQSMHWSTMNPSLGEILLTVSPVESDQHTLLDQYVMALEKILSSPCDSDNCKCNVSNTKRLSRGACRGLTMLRKDFFLYHKMLPSIDQSSTDGKLYDVKKEIYRLTDRIVAGLAKYYGIKGNGAFEILDVLAEMGKITTNGRDNLANAVAISLKLRISTYLKSGKQGEQIKGISSGEANAIGVKSSSDLPGEEELFHFFFVATPLYEELRKSFLLHENIPESFPQQEFFDCSDAVKGNIYCRILKYDKALQCYERTLEQNPENVDVLLHQINVHLDIDKSAETIISIERKLETLLRKIGEKYNLPDGLMDERGHYVPNFGGSVSSLKEEDAYQLFEILSSVYHFHLSQGNFELAQHIFYQCMALEHTKSSDMLKGHLMVFAYSERPEKLGQEQSEVFITALNALIERDGISTSSIFCLNELGRLFYVRGKYEQAYLLLQRALAMERTLCGSNFNPYIITTLTFLGVISVSLRMYEEGKMYYEQLLQLYESLTVPKDEMLLTSAHLSLAFLCASTNHHEEAISNFQKVLTLFASDSYRRESLLECITHSQMATSWHALNEEEKALNSALDARKCLSGISGLDGRVAVTCAVAEDFCTIGRYEEAISLITEGLEEFDAEIEIKHKAEYLQLLGEAYVRQGVPFEAELYYKEAVDILMIDKENTSAIVDCLLKLSTILLEKGQSSEVRSKLAEASKYVLYLNDDRKIVIFARKIEECWEKLGDINQARSWYEDVLMEFQKSSIRISVPLFEFELHIKLGDLTESCLGTVTIDSDNSDITLSSEQTQKAQRIHYDRAGKVLRRHSSSGCVNLTTILQLFLSLASRYCSIDVMEEHKLLVEALEISESVTTADTACEMIAGILTALSDIKWLAEDYVSSSDFLERSLRMELKLHSSGRYHPHISELLYRLSRLYLKHTCRKQVHDAIQLAVEFLEVGLEEEAIPEKVAWKNVAFFFWSMAIFFLSLENVDKAKNALKKANKYFDRINEDFGPSDETLHTITLESRLSEYPNFLATEDLVSTVLKPLFILCATGSPLDEILHAVNLNLNLSNTRTDQTKKTKCGKPQERLSNTVSTLIHSILPDDKSSAIDFLQPYLCKTVRSLSETTAAGHHEEQYGGVHSFETKFKKLSLLADSVDNDLGKGNIQQASKTIRKTFEPFVLSLFKHCPKIIEPAEFLINEALKAKKSNGTMMMLVYLNLADKFPSTSRRRAEICKLRGEGNLSERNYRIAALSFAKADKFLSRSSTSEADVAVQRMKVLIGLTKSRFLCNDVAGAWIACQEGLALLSTLECEAVNFRVETDMLLFSAKCLIHLTSEDRDLDEAVSFCKQGLASSMLSACSTWTELWEFFAINFQIQRLLVTALLRLNRSDDSQNVMKKTDTFLRNLRGLLRLWTSSGAATDNDVEFLEISRRLYLWIGQALIVSGEANTAENWLVKSLSAFLALGVPDTISEQEDLLALLDSITEVKAISPHFGCTSFETAIDLCMQKLLEFHDDSFILLRFFEVFGQVYSERERDQEAIVLNERALTVVECLDSSTDATNIRGMITAYIAENHRRLATRNVEKNNLSLAEKYYQISFQITQKPGASHVCYAGFLCDQGRFGEACKIIKEIVAAKHQLWNVQMSFSYGSRSNCSPVVKSYIEDHGELVTTAGVLAYCLLVRALVEMGEKREAVAACELLSVNGEEIEVFAKRPPFMPYVLGGCHKLLCSLLEGHSSFQFENVAFPLSGKKLSQLFHELHESEQTLESTSQLSGELTGSFESSLLPLSASLGNAVVTLGKEDESHPFFINFLEELQAKQGILDRPFHTQKAILSQYSFVNQYYVYDSLGILLCERGNIDGAIECVKHCLELDEDHNCGQDLVGTLAELYQLKALAALDSDKASYTKWMNAAQECFEDLRQKATKFQPFVERAYGAFLCRQGHFQEAIAHFKNVLQEDIEREIISFATEDKPLVSAYLEREIEARGEISLPLKISVYYEIACAYFKLNEMKNAQESVREMEEYVTLFYTSADYPLILSVLGYINKEIGNTERAVEIFTSVLEMNPGHAPVTIALETCS